jgi:hypothetical protein
MSNKPTLSSKPIALWCDQNAHMLEVLSPIDIVTAWEEYRQRTTHETSAGGWTVEEYRNGVWQRCAMGQAWQTNADAHQQCRELQERYPNRVFGVTTLKAGEQQS